MNPVADQQPQCPAQPRRRGRTTKDGQTRGRRQVGWGLPHRGRVSPEEAAYVREHLDEVQTLRSQRGVPLLDPADPGRRSATACNLAPAIGRASDDQGRTRSSRLRDCNSKFDWDLCLGTAAQSKTNRYVASRRLRLVDKG
jgi:hypothetical protein